MIPLKIKVKNFGAIPESEIDLSGIFLSSITGKNGYGKSTLFAYAPLFALFGRTKNNCSIDDMVRTGSQDMMVQLDFEHQKDLYQITRTRKLNKKSTLELQKKITTGWESLSGTTIAETEKKIQTLLNLDANTFMASSLILQGDASNFTAKPAGERKAILTQILGLEIYDRLRDLAKERESKAKSKLETRQNILLMAKEHLEELPETNERLVIINNQIDTQSAKLVKTKAEIVGLQDEMRKTELKQSELKLLQPQLDEVTTTINQKQSEIKALTLKQEASLQIVLEEKTVLEKKARQEQIKEQLTTLKAKAPRLEELEKDYNSKADEVDKLELEKSGISQRIKSLEKDLSNTEELKQAFHDLNVALERLRQLDTRQESYNAVAEQLRAKESELVKSNTLLDNLQLQYNQLAQKVAILLDANCINPEQAKCKFLADAQEAKSQMPDVKGEREKAKQKMMLILDEVQALEKNLTSLDYNPSNHTTVKKQIEKLRPKAEEYNSLTSKQELLDHYLAQHHQLVEKISNLTTEIDNITLQVKELKTELEPLARLETTLKGIEQTLPQELEKLSQSKAFLNTSQVQINSLQSELKQKEKLQLELQVKTSQLQAAITQGIDKIGNKLPNLVSEEKSLNAELNNLFSKQGALQEKLHNLEKDAETKEELEAEIAITAKELTNWETLIKAFSKNGIPALIIENSIPELERISNDILSQMSKGAHSLRFETQRDLKSKDGVAETLDIIVHDWAGSRPYETFSGGEQLRIDLAIRFALAELLANRAGSKVEFIVADEIFGSQDAEHRELVIEAIKAVSDRFKKVLVITHIEQAQGMFEQQINIADGGKVEVLL